MNRKEFLKSLGFITAGATFLGTGETVKAAGKALGLAEDLDPNRRHLQMQNLISL